MYREILIEFIDKILILAGFLNMFLGLTLLLKPELFIKINQKLGRWISTRQLTKPVGNKKFNPEKMLLKYNSIFGWILLVVFALSLYIYFHNVRLELIEQFLINNKYGLLIETLLVTLNWMIIIFISIGMILMLLLIFSPDTLIKITSSSDKWISTRRITKPLEKLYYNFDEFVIKHNTVSGILLIIFSVCLFFLFR
ncbi:MAG: hypothetical protein HQ510_07495 [Candidatus Marinimicrobia bacterium]|nr:hypothetical protein [Candidatus Neomarinimicrobiota bacterium]